MGVKHNVITVGTTAVLINSPEPSGANKAQSVMVSAATDVFLGGADVTTTDYGFKVTADVPLAADLGAGDNLYAIAGADTSVYVLYLGA